MTSECRLLAKIWCSPTPKAPLLDALHTACLAYLESTRLCTDPKTWSIPEPITNIEQLPSEVQSVIIENLTSVDKARLRVTNHFYHATIPRLTVTHEELLAAELEDYETEKLLLACRICHRLRHISKFANVQRAGRRGRNGSQRHKRFCLDCGIEMKFYHPSGYIYVGKKQMRVCPEHWKLECTDRCLLKKDEVPWNRATWLKQENMSYLQWFSTRRAKVKKALAKEEEERKFMAIKQILWLGSRTPRED
ncbi:hypothetical protein OCU04_001775 [Sclerotinia nivalis]|uniref:F-box domain-containing protein n=1 Tax=Sclerotinia nivalis TaxID=352851 RepID=A0A9X0AZ78_9HELO|nr:hypothetical protein OCU04_001775 [Sclerotinia nivalis]